MSSSKEAISKTGILSVFAIFRWTTIQVVILIVFSGGLDSIRFLVFLILLYGSGIVSAVIMWKIIPEVSNRRGTTQKGAKKWDRILMSIYFLIVLFIMPAVIGLDVGRFHWSFLAIEFTMLGSFLYIISFILIQWSMIENSHFEGLVRIQHDRNHRVISGGPYRFIRHPGYVGMIVTVISFPIILGSIYGLVLSVMCVVILVVRTYLEDLTLQHELNGYRLYTKKVSNRLIPGIW